MNSNESNKSENSQPQVLQDQPKLATRKKRRLKPKSKKRRLKPKQALFLKYYTSKDSPTFGNGLQSALKAGYKREYAEKITAVMSEEVRQTMTEELDRAGLTDEVLAEGHLELFNKREVVFVRNGKNSHHELTDQPDTLARKAALDMAYKIKRHYPAERLEHTGKDGEPLNLVFVQDQSELPPEDVAPDRQA